MKRDANAGGGDAAAMGSSINKGIVAPVYARKARRPNKIWNSMSCCVRGRLPTCVVRIRSALRVIDSQARESNGSDLRWRIEIASRIHQDGRGKDEAKDRRYE